MNNLACKSLVLTKTAIQNLINEQEPSTPDFSVVDPNSIAVSVYSDWLGVIGAAYKWDDKSDSEVLKIVKTNSPMTEENAVAMCKKWFDWKKYEKEYCCQMI